MKMYGCKFVGFTLVEMAVVLIIVGLMLGGLLIPLSTQMEQRRISETQQRINMVQDALIGFAIANGRLPCPASAVSAGQESFCSVAGAGACGAVTLVVPAHGRCSNPFDGFVPGVTLGIFPNVGGFVVDGWETQQNLMHYAVANFFDAANGIHSFTAPGGMRTTTLPVLAPPPPAAPASDLNVCASATGITALGCGGAANTLTNSAVAVIYSLGKNVVTGGTGVDESANPNPNSANNDRVYVSHPQVEAGVANGEFDDILVWLSPNTLYNRMVAAGRLP